MANRTPSFSGKGSRASNKAGAAVQILHLFESDRKKIRAMGRKAASSLAKHKTFTVATNGSKETEAGQAQCAHHSVG
jgi:hypothetical protein